MAGASHATKQEIDAFFKVAKSPKANQVSGSVITMHYRTVAEIRLPPRSAVTVAQRLAVFDVP